MHTHKTKQTNTTIPSYFNTIDTTYGSDDIFIEYKIGEEFRNPELYWTGPMLNKIYTYVKHNIRTKLLLENNI